MKKHCFIGYLILTFCKTKDQDFSKDSEISIEQYDTQTIENLTLLCKIWGFLKYYHPAIAEGKYNWDFELFRIMPSILDSKTVAERNTIFEKWIDSLGKIETLKAYPTLPSDSVKMYPDISWISDSNSLGNKVANQLSKIKDANRGNEHYYIDLAPEVGNPIFKNENEYISFTHPDTGYYLLALFRYWNIIQYYFPYKYLIGENWNDILPEFIPQFISAKTELEYKLTLLRLIARGHDTHANIWGDITLEKYKGMNIALTEINFIEGKAVVTGDYPNFRKSNPLQIGDIILSIDGISVDSIIEKSLAYTPGSNYPVQLRDIAQNLLRTNNHKLLVKYIRNDEVIVKTIMCYPIKNTGTNFIAQRNKKCFQILDHNIGYIYLGGTIEAIIPDNINTKGIIIDLRCYPSSEKVKGYWDFDQLYAKPTEFVKTTNGSLTQPGTFTFFKTLKAGKNNKNPYQGKIVILINEITQSHAEFVAMKYQCTPNTIIIGSTTAGADGNVSKFALPGGINTQITGIGIYYPDGKETQRIGIIPDIEVKPTIKGIQQGRDEVLEKAIQIISNKKIITVFLNKSVTRNLKSLFPSFGITNTKGQIRSAVFISI